MLSTLARVLCALPALETLRCEGVCTFSRLKTIQLHTTYFFQPQSLVDLVDYFIVTGLCHCLTDVSVQMSPSLHIIRETDHILGRLIKHIGPSLRVITLDSPSDYDPTQSSGVICANFSEGHPLDLSANPLLERLSLTIRDTHELEPCAPACRVLFQLTSTRISRIEISFFPPWELRPVDAECGANAARLRGSLLDLDTILSRPVFDNLRLIVISINAPTQRAVREEELALADWLRPCLPRLDVRGILGITVNGTRMRWPTCNEFSDEAEAAPAIIVNGIQQVVRGSTVKDDAPTIQCSDISSEAKDHEAMHDHPAANGSASSSASSFSNLWVNVQRSPPTCYADAQPPIEPGCTIPFWNMAESDCLDTEYNRDTLGAEREENAMQREMLVQPPPLLNATESEMQLFHGPAALAVT